MVEYNHRAAYRCTTLTASIKCHSIEQVAALAPSKSAAVNHSNPKTLLLTGLVSEAAVRLQLTMLAETDALDASGSRVLPALPLVPATRPGDLGWTAVPRPQKPDASGATGAIAAAEAASRLWLCSMDGCCCCCLEVAAVPGPAAAELTVEAALLDALDDLWFCQRTTDTGTLLLLNCCMATGALTLRTSWICTPPDTFPTATSWPSCLADKVVYGCREMTDQASCSMGGSRRLAQ